MVSFTWLGNVDTNRLRVWLTKAELFSVDPSQAEMIGLPGLLVLLNFGNK